VPFGGFKQFGIGRENGPLGLEGFLETKAITGGRGGGAESHPQSSSQHRSTGVRDFHTGACVTSLSVICGRGFLLFGFVDGGFVGLLD